MATTKATGGLQLEMSSDLKMLQELAQDFTTKEIIPQASAHDESSEWPRAIFAKALELGLVNINIPEAYGGVGGSVLEECIVTEAMAYGCSGIQTALMINQLAVLPILIAGTDAQKERYLTALMDEGSVFSYCMTEPDAGSDVAGIKSTAVRKGDKYILNGSKTWITGGPVASYFTVFAKTDPDARHR
ncbi:MAG: acyl-CoA dehydrogenase family protein, partial [Caldilineaceae bacterium]|nr:acyl-CoA dehydrogenase family protein [Caldilineaceae bacterium]